MKTHTKESQEKMTPKRAHEILVNGNKRFVENLGAHRDYQAQVDATSSGQFPFAIILSCIDSRVPAELVFDQGIGDIFSVRVAGNVVNKDILGSMEYACKVAGSKIVVVLGHTSCGAVTAACKQVKLGNITQLLEKIKPAIAYVKHEDPDFDCDYTNPENVDHVAVENVHQSIDQIRKESQILADLEKEGTIEIVGALYSVQTGEVMFFPW